VLEGNSLVGAGIFLVVEGNSLVKAGISLVAEGNSLVEAGIFLAAEGNSLVEVGISLAKGTKKRDRLEKSAPVGACMGDGSGLGPKCKMKVVQREGFFSNSFNLSIFCLK
jgi:hypothetical protein